MAGNLDIVGGVGVDVVPVIPKFHEKLKAAVLPIADRVGLEAGRKMGERMGDAMGAALQGEGTRVGEQLGTEIARAMSRHVSAALPDAVRDGGRRARVSATREGDNTGGAFASSLRRRLEAAFRAMPKLDIRMSDTGVDAELARIRAKLEQLSNKRIGIDVGAAEARAEVERLSAKLTELGAQHPNVRIRADTAAARAALAEFVAEIDAVDAVADQTVKIKVDTTQAQGALMALGIQLAILGAIQAGPVLAAGIGSIAAAATAAGAGVGSLALVAIPAFKSISEVIQAKAAADKDAANAAGKSAAADANAAVTAQQRALQMESAQAALASAHRNAAQSIASANRQVEQAEKAVADAVERAAEQRQSALDAVRRAEQSLADAQRSARDAEEALTQAREDAARQLRDLNDQLANGALDQRAATLRVKEAQEELNSALADPKATDLQREAAQLAYDQAVQSAKEQKQQYDDLKTSAAEQRKAGVDGNDAVKSAAERLADAQRNVRDQTQAVADAQRNVAKVTRDSAEQIATAQERVADAVENAANTQISAAESVASAERGVQSARLAGMKVTAQAATKQDAYASALAKLSPPARELYDHLMGDNGLVPAFKEWSKSLQPDVLPLFTRGVDGVKNTLPSLTPIVQGAADAVKKLQDRVSKAVKTPFWQGFKDDIQRNVEPAITGLGIAFGNLITGIAGIIDAFLPHMGSISETMQRITKKFANWGKNLKGSPEFERFLHYVAENAPRLGDFLGKLLTAAVDVSTALSPLSEVMFDIFGPLLDGLSWLAENAPGVVQTLWGLYAVNKAISLGMTAFAAAMGIYSTVVALASLETFTWAAAINATGIVPLIRLIVLVIAALAAAVIWAYNNVGWFRTAVDATWKFIKDASIFLWENVLKPIFSALWAALKWVGDAAVWLWKNAIQPAFSAIWYWARWLFTLLTTLFFLPLYLAFKFLGKLGEWLWKHAIKPAFEGIAAVGVWLWKNVLKPVFGWIGDGISWLWKHFIKPNIEAMKLIFQALGDIAKWLWDHALKPVFGWIGDKAAWLWKVAVKPQFESLKKGVGLVADAFSTAKDNIGKAWDKLRDLAKKPIKFIIDHVYNQGIVPLWNSIASITDVDKLKPMNLEGFHTGGVMSGYSPGRDDRIIAVGGGEAIMRPEWTRAVGTDTINSWNAAARQGGVSGVQRAIAAGMPAYKNGGVVDWFTGKAKSVGNFISSAAGALSDPGSLFDTARDFIKDKLQAIGSSRWAQMLAKIPLKMMSSLKDTAVNILGWGGGGAGEGGRWIKPVDVPYGMRFGVAGPRWASGHHTGLDFPAAVGKAVKAVADGKVSQVAHSGPYGNHVMINHGGGLSSLYAHMSRILTTLNARVKQGQVIGKVGMTGNATGPHLHLEARVNGRAVDPMTYLTSGAPGFSANASGAAQRYAKSILRNYGWGADQFGPLKKLWQGESGWNYRALNQTSGAYGIPQALPAAKMASAGADWRTNYRTQIRWGLGYIKNRPDYGSPAAAYSKWLSRSPHWYDDGGYLPTGLSLVANGTGRPEPVFTSSQWDTLRANAGNGGATQVHADVRVYVGDREITDIVRVEVDAREAATANAIEAGRWI